jgi:hypothetical protein
MRKIQTYEYSSSSDMVEKFSAAQSRRYRCEFGKWKEWNQNRKKKQKKTIKNVSLVQVESGGSRCFCIRTSGRLQKLPFGFWLVCDFYVFKYFGVRKLFSLGRCCTHKSFDVKRSKKKQWGKGDTNGLCGVDLSVKAAPESGTSRSRLETTRAATQRATGTIRSRVLINSCTTARNAAGTVRADVNTRPARRPYSLLLGLLGQKPPCKRFLRSGRKGWLPIFSRQQGHQDGRAKKTRPASIFLLE